MIKKEVIVEKQQKIHSFLQNYGFSFAAINKMMRNKDVKLNGKVCKENVLLQVGDEIVFYYAEEVLQNKTEILFEDEEAVVLYKYAGIESAGEKGVEEVLKVKAVHRLDRNTEGLMVYAKTEEAKIKLEKCFKDKKVEKYYVAEVVGCFDVDEVFKAYLVKDKENSFVKIYKSKQKGSVEIKTKIKTIKAGNQSSLVEVELLTGKTHQIRAHLAFLGHAIVGDGKYGKNEDNKKFKQNRQKLACFMLKFGKIGIKSLDFQEFKKYPKWLGVVER